MRPYHPYRACLLALLAAASLSAWAADPAEYTLVIRAHRFEPAELRIPAQTKVRLVVHNQDSSPEEFDSHDLNREKLIAPGAKGIVYIGPLAPGRYAFSGEFHEKTAQGVVIAE